MFAECAINIRNRCAVQSWMWTVVNRISCELLERRIQVQACRMPRRVRSSPSFLLLTVCVCVCVCVCVYTHKHAQHKIEGETRPLLSLITRLEQKVRVQRAETEIMEVYMFMYIIHMIYIYIQIYIYIHI